VLLPALERYDGPRYQVLRKFRRERPTEAQRVAIYVISAEFGLIGADEPIPTYDRRMTAARAQEIRPQVVARLHQVLRANACDDILVSAGEAYRAALRGYERALPEGATVTISAGAPGRRVAQLRAWLYRRGSLH
jgi:hypothetical protein